MAMPAIHRRWTAAQVRALIAQSEQYWPRYELLGGELIVTPAPGGIHQVAVSTIQFHLQTHMKQEPIGVVLSSPADIELQAESIVQPDVFVVPRHEGVDREGRFTWAEITSLLLAVEVISPLSGAFGVRVAPGWCAHTAQDRCASAIRNHLERLPGDPRAIAPP